MDSVALLKFRGNENRTISQGLNTVGFDKLISPVLIKPNLCTKKDGTGHTVTDIKVVKAIIKYLLQKNEDLSIRIIESDSMSKYAQEVFDFFGYTDYCEMMRKKGFDIATVDLSKSNLTRIQFEGEYFKDPDLPDILTRPHYFISVANAKTHYLSYITGVLKNLFGVLPRKDMSFYHSRIHDVIVDLARILRPDLNIVDARVGVEDWNGPKTHRIGAFIIGERPVSVDAVMTRLFRLDPNNVQHLVHLSGDEFGSLNPQITGIPIEDVSVQFSIPRVQ